MLQFRHGTHKHDSVSPWDWVTTARSGIAHRWCSMTRNDNGMPSVKVEGIECARKTQRGRSRALLPGTRSMNESQPPQATSSCLRKCIRVYRAGLKQTRAIGQQQWRHAVTSVSSALVVCCQFGHGPSPALVLPSVAFLHLGYRHRTVFCPPKS